MGRRRLLLGAGSLTLLGAVAVSTWLVLPPPGVTPWNYGRVNKGMTPQEVHTLLGEPRSKIDLPHIDSRTWLPVADPGWVEVWPVEDGEIQVYFEDRGLVSRVLASNPPARVLDRLRRFVGW